MTTKTLNHRFLLLILTFLFSLGTQALQPCSGDGPRFDPNKYRTMLEEHIIREAGFNQNEAQSFFPIYHEMKEKQRQLNHQIMTIKMSCNKEAKTDKEYLNAIEEIKDLNVDMAKLEATYYKKMCKAICPKKVFKAMRAEDFFHRDMLMKFNQRQAKGGQRNKK